MAHIIIKNIGPIKEVEFDLNKINIFMGPQSCGKSTIGKALAKKRGRTFVDTDKEIEKRAGMTIPEIFAQFSEADFRKREREVIASLSRETGLVIATGGGAPTFPENVFALRQNGLLLFLDAEIETLVATSDRPLSSTREALFALYEKRYEKYLAAGDFHIKITRNLEENLEKIQKVLQ